LEDFMISIFINCSSCGTKLEITAYEYGDKLFIKVNNYWIKVSKSLYILCNKCLNIKEE